MLTKFDHEVIDFANSLGIESDEVYRRMDVLPNRKYAYRDQYKEEELIQELEQVKKEWIIPKLYHQCDPVTKTFNDHVWHWVYIHGQAELDMDKYMNENGWDWAASDIFVSDQPRPKGAGRYPVEIYGKKALAVVAPHYGILGGRVAYLDDEIGLRHAKKPEDWR